MFAYYARVAKFSLLPAVGARGVHQVVCRCGFTSPVNTCYTILCHICVAAVTSSLLCAVCDNFSCTHAYYM